MTETSGGTEGDGADGEVGRGRRDASSWGDDAASTSVDSRRARRRQFLGTAAGGIGVSMAGCIAGFGTDGEAGDDVLTVGVLAPEPERNPVGASMVQAVELWARQRNENGGGPLGREVEVVVEDTKSSPLQGRRAYQRLVLERGVDVTTGIFETSTLDHVVHEIAAHETLHFTTGATSRTPADLVEEDNEYRFHFRVMLNDIQVVEGNFAFLREMAPEMGWETAAALTEDYQWTEDLAPLYQDSLPLETVYANHYPPETDDFGEIYGEIEAAGADAAWVGMAHTGDEALIQWARDQPDFAFGGIHVPMQLPRYYDMIDGACRYGMTQTAATATANMGDLKDEFVDAYEDAFDELPVYTGYNSYNAMLVYEAAIEEAGTTDSDALVDVLREIEVETTSGHYEFDDPRDDEARFPHDPSWEPGDADGPGAIFFQWQENEQGEGVQEAIWPEEVASGDYVQPHWI